MSRPSDAQRNQATEMLRAGLKVTDVLGQVGCSRQTIHNLKNNFYVTGSVRDVPWKVGCSRQRIDNPRNKFYVTWSVRDLPRSGRPRVTLREDRMIMLTHLRNLILPTTVAARQYGVIHRRLLIVFERILAPYVSIIHILRNFDRALSCCEVYVGETSLELYAP